MKHLLLLMLFIGGVVSASTRDGGSQSRRNLDPLRFFKKDRPGFRPPGMKSSKSSTPTSMRSEMDNVLDNYDSKSQADMDRDMYEMAGSNNMDSKYEDGQMNFILSDFKCPKKYGTWPVLQNCEHFIQCVDGEAREVSCPSDLYYNAATKECDFAAMAYCPFKCPDPNGEFPMFGDCVSYIQCVDGDPILRMCPDGQEWDSVNKQCDMPEIANCPMKCPVENGTFPYIEDCASYILCEHGRPHLKKCPNGLYFSLSTRTCQPHVAGLCPFDFQCLGRTGRFPVLGQCSMFLECNKDGLGSSFAGTVSVRMCPEGLLYNYIAEQCELANTSFCVEACPAPDGIFEIAGLCNYYKVCTNNVAQLHMCPNNLHFNPVEKHCEKATTAGCIPKCTQANGINGIPGKCNQYVECIDGVPELKHCPASLHFNQLLRVCDTPENSKCEFTCPHKNGFFPIPGKCEDYIECKDGRAIFQHCPAKLHFNNKIKMCDFPENAKCANTCPQPEGIFPVEGDCSAFVQCIRNVPTVGTCGDGHFFNVVTCQCDLAENVACDPVCPGPNGRFPLPGKPSESFLECVNNKGVIKTCSSGLRLNPVTENCDW